MRKGKIELEVDKDGGVVVLCDLPGDVASKLLGRLLTDGKLPQPTDSQTVPAGSPQPALPAPSKVLPYRNQSFGHSLYWKRRDAKEVMTFMTWLVCSFGLFVAALWKW